MGRSPLRGSIPAYVTDVPQETIPYAYGDVNRKDKLTAYNGMAIAYDEMGVSVVRYEHDAWGKPLDCTGTMALTLGADNPFRYRGYVYDEETGLYYLQSR